MILFRILEHSREMDELVEPDIREDLQSSPYNSPVDTDERSHSNDSYVREIHVTHYSELISHTPYSHYSFPQHAGIPTSSTAVNMPTPSTAVNMPTPSTAVNMPTSSTALYIPTSSIVADIPTDPTSSIVTTFAETETGVELIERTETNIDSLVRSIPLSLCLPLPFSHENSSDVSDTQFYSSKCAVCEEKCSPAKCCPGCKQPIHLYCGQFVEGIENTIGPVWCISCWIHVRSKSLQKGRISAKRGQNKQIKRMENQTNKSFVHLMWAKTLYYLY